LEKKKNFSERSSVRKDLKYKVFILILGWETGEGRPKKAKAWRLLQLTFLTSFGAVLNLYILWLIVGLRILTNLKKEKGVKFPLFSF